MTMELIERMQAMAVVPRRVTPLEQNVGLQTFRISDEDFTLMMQADILAHFDLIRAWQIMEDRGEVLAPRSQINSTEDIRAWLQQTGYKASSDNRWEVLGMA